MTDREIQQLRNDGYDDVADEIERLLATEEGAREAFGHVVEQKNDAVAECKRLRELLEGAHASIRRMSKLRGA